MPSPRPTRRAFAGELSGPHAEVTVKQDPNQIVYLAFTSGTTGKPKGVMHSDNTLLANARQLAKDWSIDDSSVVYSLSARSATTSASARR